jgi:hypothetical protein
VLMDFSSERVVTIDWGERSPATIAPLSHQLCQFF